MIHAIQDAYYQQASNPSDRNTLCALAKQIGLDSGVFTRLLDDDTIQQALLAETLLRPRFLPPLF